MAVESVLEFRGTFSVDTWATLSLRIFNSSSLVAINPEIITLTVTNNATSEEVFSETPEKIKDGLFMYDWAIPSTLATGKYLVNWDFTVDGEELSNFQVFVVSSQGTSTADYTSRFTTIKMALEAMLPAYQWIPIYTEQAKPSMDNQTYRFTFPAWNQSASAIIYRNQRIVTSGYEINYVNGSVTFDSPNLPEDQVHADYNFRFFNDDQLRVYLNNAVNMFNMCPPHSSYAVDATPDRYVPITLQGAAVEAIRAFMQAIWWPQYRILFEDKDRISQIYSDAESLKKNYEEQWTKLCDYKKRQPYVGRTGVIIQSMYTLPGGRARFFRYMFGSHY